MAWINPSILPTTKQLDTPVANTQAQVIVASPGAGKRGVIKNIEWSYSAAPTGGRLLVLSGGATIMDFDIIAGGPGSLVADIPANLANETMTVTLAAGAGAVIGKLTVHSVTGGDFFAQGVATIP